MKKRIFILLCILPIYAATKDASGDLKVASSDKGSIVFSVKQKDDYYRNVYFLDSGNLKHILFKDGFIYQKISDESISPDKKYYVFSQIETGTARSDDGESFQHEVASCVFVDLSNGCVVKKETGEFCGGDWAGTHNWTKPSGQSISIGKSQPTVDALIKDYNSSITKAKKVSSYIKYDATIDNLIQCDPVDPKNKENYSLLSKLLAGEGDVTDAESVQKIIKANSK